MIKSSALNWLRVFRSVILLALIIAGHAMYLFIIPVYLSVMSSRFRYQQAPSRHHGAPVELPSPTIVVLWEHFPGGGGGSLLGPHDASLSDGFAPDSCRISPTEKWYPLSLSHRKFGRLYTVGKHNKDKYDNNNILMKTTGLTWCELSRHKFNTTKMGLIPKTLPHLTIPNTLPHSQCT